MGTYQPKNYYLIAIFAVQRPKIPADIHTPISCVFAFERMNF